MFLGTSAATDLSAGGYHMVRVDGGAVIGLGDGTYGQLGANPAGAPATVAGLSGITDVAAGGFSTLALKSDGTVWFLGEDTLQHTTPHGTPNPVSTPVQIPGLAGIDAIAAGHRHYLALDADTGDLYAWGHNGSGQVGNGGLLDVATPVVVLTGVASMSAGDGFSLAVKSDHTLWAWGRNGHGQLGLGDTADRLSPTQVSGVTTADAVAAGGRHALLLLTGGSVQATGDNEFGQLGLGTTNPSTTFTTVPGLSGTLQIAAGYHHSAALDGAAQVRVWGRNFEGQCGGGSSSSVTITSAQVLAGLTGTPSVVDCGYHFTLVGFADDSVAGTGSNSDGQINGSSVADQDDSQKVLEPQLLPLVPDQSPPTPNPMSFASPPAALGGGSITMTATSAVDPSGVEYFFECVSGPGNDSGWQDSPTYVDSGLLPQTEYGYRVRARDKSPQQNLTGDSPTLSATTGVISFILATDFSGRTVSGKIAQNVIWTTGGVSDPGDLTAVDEAPTNAAFTSLFNTANAQGHFAPDKNLGTEGPWSVSIPLVLTVPQLRIDDVVIDWQHFSNTGDFQTASRSANWTVSLTGSVSGAVASTTALNVAGLSGVRTLTFNPPPVLTNGETYTLKVFVAGSNGDGNNTGIDAITVNGAAIIDETPPQVASLSPANGATGISVGTDLVLAMNEIVRKGTGNIVVKEALANHVVATLAIGSGAVTVSGAEVTVGLPADLAQGTRYYVEIEPGALEDLTGNPHGGIAGSAVWSFTTALGTVPSGSLISHYTFDVDNGGTTPDSVGSGKFATLGTAVNINTTSALIGAGAFEMNGGNGGTATGALTSNTFTWSSDVRTVSFWYKSDNIGPSTNSGTFVGMGVDSVGQRFDIKEFNASAVDLRVEISGGGTNSQADIHNQQWHHIAIVVPNDATLNDVVGYVDGVLITDFNPGTDGSDPINTAASQLLFGSTVSSTSSGRVPVGLMDDFQLYDVALSPTQIQSLFNSPGSVIDTPADDFAAYISDPAFGIAPGERGFSQDPDGDSLANGLEAWFGTHPGEFDAGLAGISTDGTTTTFTHPRNASPPTGIIGFYEWSPNLVDWYAGDGVDGPPGGSKVTCSAEIVGGVSTVTATTDNPTGRLFFRAGALQIP